MPTILHDDRALTSASPELLLRIRVLRNAVLDAEAIVDDCRQDLVRAVEALRVAVQRRDALARDFATAIVEAERVA